MTKFTEYFSGSWLNTRKLSYSLLLLFALFRVSFAFCQQSLQVSINRFGKTKKFEVFTYENLEYKLKGDILFRKNKIATMRDSIIVFNNDSVIFLRQIKSIRLRKNVPHLPELTFVLKGLGVAFFGLNTFDNLIIDGPHSAVNGVAAGISGGLFTLGCLVKQLGIKRIRITENKVLRIVDMNYNNLNVKN